MRKANVTTAGAPVYGPQGLSTNTQRKVLSLLRARALQGDIPACEALLRLGMAAGRTVVSPVEEPENV